MKKTLIFIMLGFCAYALMAQQEPLKQKLEMRIDSIGNARIKVSMTMNAGQWQTWLQSVGNNPALLKRNMERTLPGFFLDDFQLEKNDMERSFEFSMKAYGACEVNRRGKWIVNTEQKNADITQLTDHKYMMVFMDAANNIQVTQFLEFPPAAKNITISKDAYDRTQFEFDMAAPGQKTGIMFWAGLMLILAGGGWIIAEIVTRKKVS
jgi:hypothetical protein